MSSLWLRGGFALVVGCMWTVSLGCAPASLETTARPEASGAPDTLLVYALGRSESVFEPLFDRFFAETGTRVQATYGHGPELIDELARTGNAAGIDVLIVQDLPDAAAAADLLVPLPSTILERVPPWARSMDGRWVGLSGRHRVVVFNPEQVTEAELPDEISDFTRPEWSGGRIGWAPTNVSFQTMLNAFRIAWGEDRTEGWLRGIMANSPKVYGGNTQLVRAVAAGEVDVGFVNHSYALRLGGDPTSEFLARNHYLMSDAPASVAVVSGAGVLRGSDQTERAHDLLALLLSADSQGEMSSSTLEYPLALDARPADILPPVMGNEPGRMEAFELRMISDLIPIRELLAELELVP